MEMECDTEKFPHSSYSWTHTHKRTQNPSKHPLHITGQTENNISWKTTWWKSTIIVHGTFFRKDLHCNVLPLSELTGIILHLTPWSQQTNTQQKNTALFHLIPYRQISQIHYPLFLSTYQGQSQQLLSGRS